MTQFYDEDMVFKISDQEFYKFKPGEEADYSPAELAVFASQGKMAMDRGEEPFKGIIFGSDLAKGFDVVIEGESTLPISRQERRVEAMQLTKIASETRRPPTEEEMQKDPMIPQKYPQGLPVMDVSKVVTDILLPTFNVIDQADYFLWAGDTTSPDRKRGVGRPEDVLSGQKMTNELMQSGVSMTGGPQPADQGVNQMERIENII